MPVTLNRAAEAHASNLIATGNFDARAPWSFDAADGDKLLGSSGDDWANYAKWFLAEDSGEPEKTKARYKYPFGKNGKVYRRALAAVRSRAQQQNVASVFEAAGRLMQEIEKKVAAGQGTARARVAPSGQSWFAMRASADSAATAEIYIYDMIGAYGIDALAFIEELRALGEIEQIVLHINSPGGAVDHGLAIFNALAAHPAQKRVVIDGIAASMGSVVAMVGNVVEMPEASLLMIHNPIAVAQGDSRTMETVRAGLQRMEQSMITAYQNKSGLERDHIAQIMANETWFSAQEAYDIGFADVVSKPVKMAASFDLSQFKHVPASAAQGQRGLSAPEDGNKEVIMTEAEQAAAAKAEKEAIQQAEAKAHAEAKTIMQNYAAEVCSLCQLAGKPELSGDFIAKAIPIDKVKEELLAAKVSNAGGSTVSRQQQGQSKGKASDIKIDATAIYAGRAKAMNQSL